MSTARRFVKLSLLLPVLSLTSLTACDASQEDPGARYQRDAAATTYMAVYGYQSAGLFPLPRDTHTFAVFIRATGEDLETAELDDFTISWLPKDGIIGFGEGVKPGRNYSLEETLDIAAQQRYVVQRTPIRQISPALFELAQQRKAALDAGSVTDQVEYRMIDSPRGRQRILAGLPGGFTNCIHAVSDAFVQNGQLLLTGTAHGFSASDAVYNYLSRFVISNQSFDTALAPRLGM
jgi:hypothetical protein